MGAPVAENDFKALVVYNSAHSHLLKTERPRRQVASIYPWDYDIVEKLTKCIKDIVNYSALHKKYHAKYSR